MTAFRPLAATHHLLSLALAAAVTGAVLTSLEVQADARHAAVLAEAAAPVLARVALPGPGAERS